MAANNMVLDAAQPYVRVWRSKGGKSRVVLVWEAPEEVLTLLHKEWQRRLALASGSLVTLIGIF